MVTSKSAVLVWHGPVFLKNLHASILSTIITSGLFPAFRAMCSLINDSDEEIFYVYHLN